MLPDADVKKVAPQVFNKAFFNTGQVCVAIKRLFVHESQYDQMLVSSTLCAVPLRFFACLQQSHRWFAEDGVVPELNRGVVSHSVQADTQRIL